MADHQHCACFTGLEASSLVMLDTATAMKLAVAWQYLDHAKTKDLNAQWGAGAGIEAWQAAKFGNPLRRCGICRDDGTTHPLALQYVAKTMLAGMSKGKK